MVLGSRSRRGQKLQPPVQPPEGGEGGAGHEEPRGRHGLAGWLGPDPSLGLLSAQSRHIQRPLRGLRTSFPSRLHPWTPPPAPPTDSALTFPGLVHAPNPRLGGDWSSRGPPPLEPQQPIVSRPSGGCLVGGFPGPNPETELREAFRDVDRGLPKPHVSRSPRKSRNG